MYVEFKNVENLPAPAWPSPRSSSLRTFALTSSNRRCCRHDHYVHCSGGAHCGAAAAVGGGGIRGGAEKAESTAGGRNACWNKKQILNNLK